MRELRSPQLAHVPNDALQSLFDEWTALQDAMFGPVPGLAALREPPHPLFDDAAYYDDFLTHTGRLCGLTALELRVVQVVEDLRADEKWWRFMRDRMRGITSRQANREFKRISKPQAGAKATGLVSRKGRLETALQHDRDLGAYLEKFGRRRPKSFLHHFWEELRRRVPLRVEELIELEWHLGKDRRKGRTKEQVGRTVSKAVQSLATTKRKRTERKPRRPRPTACEECGKDVDRKTLEWFKRKWRCPKCL